MLIVKDNFIFAFTSLRRRKKCHKNYENNFVSTTTSSQFLKCSFSILLWIPLKRECIIDLKVVSFNITYQQTVIILHVKSQNFLKR